MKVEILNLQKSYASRLAVDVPELEIATGAGFGLVGSNGAGKTTLLRLILDLVRKTDGEVQIDGRDVSKTSDWKRHTGSYLGASFLLDFLTPKEFFLFVGSAYDMTEQQVTDSMADFGTFFPGDDTFESSKLIRDLSSGVIQKVGLISAILVKPELLVLDEPFNNLDPRAQMQLKHILVDLNRHHGITLVISSHNMLHIADLCDRIAIMDKGRIIRDLATNAQTLPELMAHFSTTSETSRRESS